ncbi:CC0125/CC1285 family lipoprotein [Nguyenibacter sp. L1]|uniref:CC0125/CC1285 family lipoprotein n=1 Tax=Nguyenibacter sp. L1 TaxID=3049350 RepID=UPI002B4A80AF|nr:hypothetical protein [Nguyenibacter sp. L1]WRH86957.1 hypothetical protein QN315_13280 [Nguyenibacter sp. L1]
MPVPLMTVRQIAAISGLIIATACTHPTPYQPATKAGEGYTTQQIETNRFRISFRGNAETSRQTVDTYMLYRCAEVTLENGYDYFVIVNKAVDKNTAYESYGDNLAWGWRGGWGWRHGRGGVGPWDGSGTSYSQPINSYDAIADIVLYHGTKPLNDLYAYDAREVMHEIGPTVIHIEPAPGAPTSPAPS